MFLKSHLSTLILWLVLLLYNFTNAFVLSEEDCSEVTYCIEQSSDLVLQLKNKTRYDNARVYDITLRTTSQEMRLKELVNYTDAIVVIDHVPGAKRYVLVTANIIGDFEDFLKVYSFEFTIPIYNFQLTIHDNLEGLIYADGHIRVIDWEHYYNLYAIYQWMDNLNRKYPDIVEIINIGNSTEGRPMKGLKVDFNEGYLNNNSAVVIEAGIYADQWITTATATYFINELFTTHSVQLYGLARSFVWLIFPTVNPDGYEYTMTSNRMWRKNRNNNLGVCFGVNLNRNFATRWNTFEPTKDPCDINYQGTHSGSEMETQNLMIYLRNFTNTTRIRTYIALHSFSQQILYPYSSKPDPARYEKDLSLLTYTAKMSIYEHDPTSIYESGKVFTNVKPYSGSSIDWAHETLQVPIALIFDLRGPENNITEFFVPAERIKATAKDFIVGLIQILKDAELKGFYKP